MRSPAAGDHGNKLLLSTGSVLLPYPARHPLASTFCVLAPSILPLLRGLGHSGPGPLWCFTRPRASAQASFRFLFSQHPAEHVASAQDDSRNCWLGIVKGERLRIQVIRGNQLSLISGDPAEPSCQLEATLRQNTKLGLLGMQDSVNSKSDSLLPCSWHTASEPRSLEMGQVSTYATFVGKIGTFLRTDTLCF